MNVKKIFNDHPGGTDSLRVVILPSVEEWLRVTVVHTWVNEHLYFTREALKIMEPKKYGRIITLPPPEAFR